MRITQKQLAANRKNCKKSTGPKTKEGKQIASQNNMKHGLYTRALILNSPAIKDDLTDYNSLIYALDSDLQPDGLFEQYLIRKIANCIWRSRRVIFAENAQIECQLENIDRDVEHYINFRDLIDDTEEEPTPELLERVKNICIGRESIPNENIGRNIMRYEMRIDRQLTRTMKLFFDYQKRRKSLNNNEEQLLPPKMSDRTHFPPNPLSDIPIQEVD